MNLSLINNSIKYLIRDREQDATYKAVEGRCDQILAEYHASQNGESDGPPEDICRVIESFAFIYHIHSDRLNSHIC